MKNPLGTVLLVLALSLCGIPCSCSTATPEEDFGRGRELMQEGKRKKAYKHLKRAARNKKTDGAYHWAAALAAPNQNAAFVHAELAWKNGLKRPDVLVNLIGLSFHTSTDQKREYAFSLFDELPDSARTPMLKADLLYRFEQFDSALVIYKDLYRQSWAPKWVTKIALAYNRKGAPDSALAVLNRARNANKLDGSGYTLLASMLFHRGAYDEIDRLFGECRRNRLYDGAMQVEHAMLLTLQGRLGDARSIASSLRDTVDNPSENLVHHRARTLLSYVLYLQGDSNGIARLRDYVAAEKPAWRKAEGEFHDAVLRSMRGDSAAIAQLEEAREKLSSSIVHVAFARECLKRQQFTKAVEAYKALPPAFLSAPSISVEFARALAAVGDEEEALVVLGALHKRRLLTKASLELFRDLSARRDLVEKSLAAQKLLEKKFGDDVGVRWSGAMLAFKQGKTDSALVLLTKLAKEHPEESRFELARLSTILHQGDYEKVLRECAGSKGPPESVALIRARACRKLGRKGEADAAFTRALGTDRMPAVLMEYADFLIAEDEPKKAVTVYQEIMKNHAEQLEKDSLANAVVLNNLAWANLDTREPDLDNALWAAEKAYELAPDNLHILDTYADALVRAGKYRDCVRLLDNNPTVAREPRLIHHLALALEKDGNTNRAVRYYQDILAAMDSTSVLPLPFTREEVTAKIQRLTAK